MPEPVSHEQIERTNPHDPDIEFALLAELLLWPDEAWSCAAGAIAWQDFYGEREQKVARALMEAIEDGSPLDALMLRKRFKAEPLVEELCVSLVVEGAPTGANIPMHVAAVKELAVKRGIIAAGEWLAQEGRNGRPAREVLAENRVRAEDLEREVGGRATMNEWTAPSLLKAELVEPITLVGSHLLDQGGLSIFSGKGGLGKSRLSLALAVDLCRGGGEWLRQRLPEEPCRALYLWGEGGDYFARDRLRTLREAAEKAEGCTVMVPKDVTPDLREPGAVAEMRIILDRLKPHIVFVDHISEWSGGMNDSDNAECKVFLRVLAGLRRRSGAHFMVIAHNRKPGENSKKGDQSEVRGGSALVAAADSVLMLDEEPGERVRVTWAKVKNAARPEPMICKYDPATGRYVIETTRISNAQTSADAVKDALYRAQKPLTMMELQISAGLSESTVKRVLHGTEKKPGGLVGTGEVIEKKGIGFPNTYELPL